MTAAAIVRKAYEDGVHLTLTPAGTIKAVGGRQAVARWLTVLQKHRSEIVNLLRVRPSDALAKAQWSNEDWLALFDERAALAEFDGGLSRREAEDIAFDECVMEWRARHDDCPNPAAAVGDKLGLPRTKRTVH